MTLYTVVLKPTSCSRQGSHAQRCVTYSGFVLATSIQLCLSTFGLLKKQV